MAEHLSPLLVAEKNLFAHMEFLERLSGPHSFVNESTSVDLFLTALLCRRGTTEKSRSVCWKLLLGFLPPEPSRWEEVLAKKTLEYRELLCVVCLLDESGDVIFGKGSCRSVDVDIPRTMSSMHFFRINETTMPSTAGEDMSTLFSPMQQSLRRIIHTLAGVNKELGYVQGMNELVGHLLYAFARGRCDVVNDTVEAEVFFCFQAMLAFLGNDFCCSFDIDKSTGVMGTIRHFERLFQFMEPELWSHFEKCQVESEFYAFRWITLLFTQEFSVPDVFRIWDFLFSFGEDLCSAVLYVCVAMLSYQRDTLMRLNHLSTILPLLQSYPPCDVNEFLYISMKWIDCYGFRLVRELKETTAEELLELKRQRDTFGGSDWSWRGTLRSFIDSVRDVGKYLKI